MQTNNLTWALRLTVLVALAVLVATVASCSPRSALNFARDSATAIATAKQSATSAATPTSPATPNPSMDSSAPTPTPTVASPPTSTLAPSPSAGTTSSPAGVVTPTAALKQAIQDVILKANHEQEQAFATHDDTVMRDTATDSYYARLVQTNRDLASNGVAAIKLVKIEWGPIVVKDASTVEATTFETWQTTWVDGSTDQGRDRNVYTLVKVNGTWKIQEDLHPDTGLDQPPGDTAPTTPGSPPLPTPRIVPIGPNQSHNWSGYVATNGTYTAVSGTWTVPEPGASVLRATGATWVGIGGVSRRDLIQAGTEETTLGGGQVRYGAWIETLPQPSRRVPLQVSPGDSVTVTITHQSGDEWLVVLKNNTTGKSYQETVQYSSSLSSAEWIEEAPSGGRRVLPLDNFGTIKFTDGWTIKDGKKVTIAQAGARPVSMVDGYGQVIAEPSSLGSDGASFTVSRLNPLQEPRAAPTRSRLLPGLVS